MTSNKKTATLEAAASFAVAEAKRLGATEADVTINSWAGVDTSVRDQEVEQLEGVAEGRSVNLRVFIGKNVGNVSTTDLRRRSITKLVRDAVAMAKASQPDPFAGLPEPSQLSAKRHGTASSVAPEPLTPEQRVALALACEKAARDFDPRIVNSEGCGFSDNSSVMVYANSHGFVGSYEASSFSLSASVVAAEGDNMQVSWWYDAKVRPDLLDKPEAIGRKASQRALRMLGARKVDSQECPVVVDPLIAQRLLGQINGAAYARSIARRSSFLVGRLGQKIGSDKLTIIDDPFLVDAFGSRPFGYEGLALSKRVIVEKGVLTSYLVDAYGGRQINMAPNGGASTNLYIAKGEQSPEEIIKSVKSGLYLTEISGPGFNSTTGDVSLGASGLWIENGELAYPVQEITVASTIFDMLNGIEAVGNDLEFRGASASPTLLIGKMMVAGK